MLCWGGPEHGRVVVLPSQMDRGDVWFFPIQRRVTYKITESTDPMGHAIQKVRYDVERVGFNGYIWKVLVYPENKDRHQQRLIDVMNSLAQLCTPDIWRSYAES